MRFIKGGGAGFIEGHLLPVTLRGIWEDGVEKMGEGGRCYTVISKDEQADRSTGGKTQQKSKQTKQTTTKTTKKKEKKRREEQKEKSYVGI